MIQRLVLVVTVIVAVSAGIHDSYPQSHGSSYSIISHHPSAHSFGSEAPSFHHHLTPSVEIHSVPSLHYSSSLHSSPQISHHQSGHQIGSEASSFQHHLAPSVQVHSAPSYHYATALHSAPAVSHYSGNEEHKEPFDHHPKYSYKYGVSDKHHGDYKSAEEERDGDVVRGSYTLLQPDGVSRTVKYTADKKSGFNAVVEYKGKAKHPAPSHHDSSHASHFAPTLISHAPSHSFSQ